MNWYIKQRDSPKSPTAYLSFREDNQGTRTSACNRASVCVSMPEPGLQGAPCSTPAMHLQTLPAWLGRQRHED